MTERDERPRERQALERLKDALQEHGVSAAMRHETAYGCSSGESLHEIWYWQLLLTPPPRREPARVVAAPWRSAYVWGHRAWPMADPVGLAEEIARHYTPCPT